LQKNKVWKKSAGGLVKEAQGWYLESGENLIDAGKREILLTNG